eukprot:scpid107464/ scgid8407/ 
MERSSKSKRAPIQAEKCTDRASAPTPVPANGAYSAPTHSDLQQGDACSDKSQLDSSKETPPSCTYMRWVPRSMFPNKAWCIIPLLCVVIAVLVMLLKESREQCVHLENTNKQLENANKQLENANKQLENANKQLEN